MNNASFYRINRIEEMYSATGVKLLYFTLYSLDLNSIEEFFAELKAFIKKHWKFYWFQSLPLDWSRGKPSSLVKPELPRGRGPGNLFDPRQHYIKHLPKWSSLLAGLVVWQVFWPEWPLCLPTHILEERYFSRIGIIFSPFWCEIGRQYVSRIPVYSECAQQY